MLSIGQPLKGYRLFDVVQAQATLTRIFRPIESLGVDQWLLVGELGVTHVRDIPDRDKLLLEGAQTNLPGTTGSLRLARSNFGSSLPQQDGGYADATSWGYQIRARFDFLNAIGPVNLFPNIAFSHDFSGTTPAPLGNFIEGRGSVSVGLEATYQNSWSAGISYTNFFSFTREQFNALRDRDFVALNVRYTF